jgi:hypothetical protein
MLQLSFKPFVIPTLHHGHHQACQVMMEAAKKLPRITALTAHITIGFYIILYIIPMRVVY